MLRYSPLPLLLLILLLSPAHAGNFSVTIKAVDANNQPVARADAALNWMAKDGAMLPVDPQPAVTDDGGKAVVRTDDRGAKRPVLVLSADRKLGGIVGISAADDGKEFTVTLGPTARVKGSLECKELNTKPAWANTMVSPAGYRDRVAQDFGQKATFAFVLPAGEYAFNSYGGDVLDVNQKVTVKAGGPDIDLGAADMKANPIAKLKGKVAPEWTIADARGVPPTAKLADFKGKWVYLEFWGFW